MIESTEAGEKHSLMNVNVKGIKKNLAALKMFNELRPSPSFIVVTETWNQDLDQAQIPGELFLNLYIEISLMDSLLKNHT